MIPPPVGRHAARAFTLVEMFATLVVLSLMMVLVSEMFVSTSSLFRMTGREADAFATARAAFERTTRTLAQATLNPSWSYDSSTAPTKYTRHSDLQFVCGPASSLLGDPSWTTHSVFFQAPLGYSTDPADMPKVSGDLNVVGYAVQFGSDSAYRPAFLANSAVPLRYRFRLVEVCQSSGNFSVYPAAQTGGNISSWYTTPLADPASTHVLAENVIALILQPRSSSYDAAPAPATYAYDSRNPAENGGNDLNQLPPLVQVTLVTIDEAGAVRLQAQDGSAMPDLGLGPLFQNAGQYQNDLATLEAKLDSLHLDYRVFSSSVPILQAKWSP